jgi:hypothetical protein
LLKESIQNGGNIQTPSLERDAIHQEIRKHLVDILQSASFSGSPRMRRFLSFVVEQSLAGRADRLKEYTIAIEVFGRGESFDPRIDAIVRVEARRLRGKLDEYYSSEGRGHSLRIRVPCGGYVPQFGGDSSDEEGRRLSKRSLFAQPLVALTPLASSGGQVSEGVYNELEMRLALGLLKQAGVELVWSEEPGSNNNQAAKSTRPAVAADYVLRGTISSQDSNLRMRLWLCGKSGAVAWQEEASLRRDDSEPQERILESLVSYLLQSSADRHLPRQSKYDTVSSPNGSNGVENEYDGPSCNAMSIGRPPLFERSTSEGEMLNELGSN